ncbi:hypothetical protein ACHMW7_20880 [Aminobacter sp. UC22_36]|uniref:hypothetical protein n=1 Tax=Aminobacter sp. UC22_36 TaxID=3374549 RepID=UPI003756A95D
MFQYGYAQPDLVGIVADTGREDDVDWGESICGPGLRALLEAVTNTTFSAAVRDQLDALKFAVGEWRGELIRYRCSLSAETVRRSRGSLAGWNCRDVHRALRWSAEGTKENASRTFESAGGVLFVVRCSV